MAMNFGKTGMGAGRRLLKSGEQNDAPTAGDAAEASASLLDMLPFDLTKESDRWGMAGLAANVVPGGAVVQTAAGAAATYLQAGALSDEQLAELLKDAKVARVLRDELGYAADYPPTPDDLKSVCTRCGGAFQDADARNENTAEDKTKGYVFSGVAGLALAGAAMALFPVSGFLLPLAVAGGAGLAGTYGGGKLYEYALAESPPTNTPAVLKALLTAEEGGIIDETGMQAALALRCSEETQGAIERQLKKQGFSSIEEALAAHMQQVAAGKGAPSALSAVLLDRETDKMIRAELNDFGSLPGTLAAHYARYGLNVAELSIGDLPRVIAEKQMMMAPEPEAAVDAGFGDVRHAAQGLRQGGVTVAGGGMPHTPPGYALPRLREEETLPPL